MQTQVSAQSPPSSSVPHPTSVLPRLLLSLHLGADSWACFIEAEKEALLWG